MPAISTTRRVRALIALTAAALLAVALSPAAPRAVAKAEGYTIDPVHSTVFFRIKHMNISYVYGRFDEFTGTFTLDDENPAGSSVKFEVKSSSVDTGTKARDDHLRSPDFFNAAQFPTIAFQSTEVKKADDGHFDVTGNLTLHGVTKPVAVRMEKTGEGKDMKGNWRVGFEGTLTIQRSQFGMTGMVGPVADAVGLTVSVEASKE